MSKKKVTFWIEEGEVELLKLLFNTDNQSETIRLATMQSLATEDSEKVKTLFPYAGLIPDIKVTKVEGMRYGFADFESAGVVKETQYLPENMWKMSDAEQFKWLDEQIGGTVDGYTWHHTEIPGKMQLVPTGIHNITTHNGGRTAGMWADAPR